MESELTAYDNKTYHIFGNLRRRQSYTINKKRSGRRCPVRTIAITSVITAMVIIVLVSVLVILLALKEMDSADSVATAASQDNKGTWTNWGDWSSCSVSCGAGTESRTRICEMQTNDQPNCDGEPVMEQSCQQPDCQDISSWATWQEWSSCDATCGEGLQTRYRQCDTSYSQGQCSGNAREVALCNNIDCPVYGLWTPWSSWGSCSKSCGSGTQTRSRDCQKQSVNDEDCVGQREMQTSCNNWDCPDCTRPCNVGMLNETCDTCVCERTNVTIRTLTTNKKPLMGVESFASTAQNTLLATSDASGAMILNNICYPTDIVLRIEGYQETLVTVTSSGANVQIPAIELPIITTRPTSKYRLTGGGVRFCCSAQAAPAITYFEWFKDGILVEEQRTSNETYFELLNLTTQDSGKYKCRANSPIGSIVSEEAQLKVKDTPEDFCQGALEDKDTVLPKDCIHNETNSNILNTGTCRSYACQNETFGSENSCSDTRYACCRPSDYDFIEVQCRRYVLSVAKVVACSCGSCSLPSLRISGVARGKQTNEPLRYGRLLVDGEFVRYTGRDGSFSISLASSPSSQSVTLQFQDSFYNNFHDMIKVVDIPAATTNGLYLSIKLIEKPAPFEIQSDVETVLYGGSSSVFNSSSAVTELIIPEDSFYYDNGTKHSGSVSVIFTYLLPTDVDESEVIPGVFQFINTDGESGLLETLGVFNLQFNGINNEELTVSAPIDIALTGGDAVEDPESGERVKLWGLNNKSGIWELLPFNQNKKRKRRQSSYVIGQVLLRYYYWSNIDIIRPKSDCFFSPTLYSSRDDTELLQTTYQVSYLYVRSDIEAYWWTKHTFNEQNCQRIHCSGVSAFLSIETVSTQGNTFLVPKPSPLYTITDDQRAVEIIMQKDDNIFFSSEANCNVAQNQNLLSFHKPEDDTNIYTFNWFSFFSQSNVDDATIDLLSNKAWCRDGYPSAGSTKACAMKINVINGANYNLKVNVISKMGDAIPSLTNDVVGVREVVPDKENGMACVPYRCNTIINDAVDQTNVHIYIQTTDAICTLIRVSPDIPNYGGSNGELTFVVNDDLHTSGLYLSEHQKFDEIQNDCKDLADKVNKNKCTPGNDILATFRCT